MRAFQKMVYSKDEDEFNNAKESFESLEAFNNNDKLKK